MASKCLNSSGKCVSLSMNLDTLHARVSSDKKQLTAEDEQRQKAIDGGKGNSHDNGVDISVGQVRVKTVGAIDAQLKLLARIFRGVHGLGQKDLSDPILAYLLK
jgi:hypothetical protein